MSPRVRAAVAGSVAAVVWGLQEPLDQRLFGCDYSDVLFLGRGHRSIGFLVHAANGALFGIAFDAVRQRVDVDQRRLALALATGEHLALWPFISLVDRSLGDESACVRAGDVPACALRIRPGPPRLKELVTHAASVDLDR